MECFWGVCGHWKPVGDSHQQYPALFYVCVYPYNGLSDYYLHDTRLLAECQEIYLGSKKEPVVLLVRGNGQKVID